MNGGDGVVTRISLKGQFQRKLNLTGRISGGNGSNRTGGDVRVGITEVRVVQHIEELATELESHAFPERQSEVLVDPQIPLEEIGRAESVTAQIAEWGTCARDRKCSLVEVVVEHGRTG